MLKHIAEFFAI
jgi:transposase